MKRIISILVLTIFLIGIITVNANAQDPADPSINTGTNGSTTGVVGGGSGATLASGMYILLLLGGVYAGYKIYQVRQKKEELIGKCPSTPLRVTKSE